MTDIRELWREEFVVNCYVDQTGAKHNGRVVHERLTVTDTGERFDVNDGYSINKGLGKVFEAPDGRKFGIYPETVDYSGGTHIKRLYDVAPGYEELGYWKLVRSKYDQHGRVYPNRTGPVKPLLSTTFKED